MSSRNVANINAPSITLGGTTATALASKSEFLLIYNPGTTGAYVETGLSGVTSTSLKGFVPAGTVQLFRVGSAQDTHIISTQAGLVVQSVNGS